jgi:hypothetical protein
VQVQDLTVQFVLVQIIWTSSTVCMLNITLSVLISFSQFAALEDRKCAADFSLLNLPKGKSLGRSKPATNS